jgi:hypothetical protein
MDGRMDEWMNVVWMKEARADDRIGVAFGDSCSFLPFYVPILRDVCLCERLHHDECSLAAIPWMWMNVCTRTWTEIGTPRLANRNSFYSNWCVLLFGVTQCHNQERKGKGKEKITLVYVYHHDCEPVGLTFITFYRDMM